MDKRDDKESRVRNIALLHYSRKDILENIYRFSKNREVIPKYYERFGKRPDSFQYPADIISLVKKGATSFHCSEELWSEPTQILTSMNQEQLNKLRFGWDLIIDIDCKWIYYSKKAAISIIQTLKSFGVENVGVKFSGNKGFHIIIPWNAFPEFIGDIKTSDMFPEWPRAIVNFLKEKSRTRLAELIKDTEYDFKNLKGYSGVICKNCNNLASENLQITIRCPKCHPPHIEIFKSQNQNYKKRTCPTCKSEMKEVEQKIFFYCHQCNINSLDNNGNFDETIKSTNIFEILGLDMLLISSRHLFRMPYSLHEKTSLASVVIKKNKIEEFEVKDANPFNVNVLDFYPKANQNEAKTLLLEAIDFQKSINKQSEKKIYFEDKKTKKFERIKLDKINEENFPPSIQKILKGMVDGKKRALFILINFFRSLGMPIETIEKKINEWNKLNNPPLKQGYINTQLMWHSKHNPVMPPNFDNEIYKAIDVYEMDELSLKVKNPVNYVVRKSKTSNLFDKKDKNR
ncbi:MAG: hypothetical protein QW727_01915 [Candidatus Pacearchaeota archaeon]